jgi:anti-sigma-K factor RskA
MNIRHNGDLREKLAAEYVLGTLKAGARRRFETWLKDDAALRRAVDEWQDRLCPMAEFTPAVTPPNAVWRKIEKELGEHQRLPRQDWKNSLFFWRRLGLVSSAIAMTLVAYLSLRQLDAGMAAPNYVAVLADKEAHTALVVTGDRRHSRLQVKVLLPQTVADNQTLELWALPKQGHPRSLGLIPASGVASLELPANLASGAVPNLAVSLEPKGGSHNPDGPTGPVLFTGAWVQI